MKRAVYISVACVSALVCGFVPRLSNPIHLGGKKIDLNLFLLSEMSWDTHQNKFRSHKLTFPLKKKKKVIN